MKELSIDIETYSSNDLKKGGVYKYVEAHDFAILLFAYSIDKGPVVVIDFVSGQMIPDEVYGALTDPNVIKKAFNAQFERTCLANYFLISLPAEQWQCTMVKAAMVGMPMSLAAVSEVLQLTEGKLSTGKDLIRYFCIPCKPTKANGGRLRNWPSDAPDKWASFIEYCRRDVVAEQRVDEKMDFYEVLPVEREMWRLDQQINDDGVLLDRGMIASAVEIDRVHRVELTEKAAELTGLNNPNSVSQLKIWFENAVGEEIKSLAKKAIPAILTDSDDEAVQQVMALRSEMSKSAVKKYNAMQHFICYDDRARGLLQYYGAGRTGRFAGRGIQVQNLKKNNLPDLWYARELVLANDREAIQAFFGDVSDTLSQLVRTAFIAAQGSRLQVCDYSAIEAVVIAYLSGEGWRMELFYRPGKVKIYEASASKMFNTPIDRIVEGNPEYELRQRGKVAELALGYQGGPNALITMGALEMGIKEDELPGIVKAWREANPKIVRFWYDCQDAAIKAVETGETITIQRGISFSKKHGMLFITLPSGRKLSYPRVKIKAEEFIKVKDKETEKTSIMSLREYSIVERYGKYELLSEPFVKKSLSYEGPDQKTGKWSRIPTYGGKIVENIVQAFARDCLVTAMLKLDKAGYRIVMHVHDEVVIETPYGQGDMNEIKEIMAEPIPWAPGLPLKAEGYETEFYMKK